MAVAGAKDILMPEEAKTPQRWALVAALALVVLPLALAVTRMERGAVFPSKNDRFDVTRFFVADARRICPSMAAMPSQQDLEQCLATQSLDEERRAPGYSLIRIPGLDDLPVNSYPSLETLLKDQGASEVLAALARRNLLIFGFKVPDHYFTPNAFQVNPNVLVLAQVSEARICYLGQCRHFAETNSYLGLQFPLFAPPAGALPPEVDVWIAVLPSARLSSLNFEHGLFVTNVEAMRAVNMIHKPLILGAWMIESALLLGIVMMAMLYAVLWAEYIDFTAFAVLVDFLLLMSLKTIVARSYPSSAVDRSLIDGMTFVLMAQVAIAATFFAVSTLRPRPKRFWFAWLAVAVSAGVLVLSFCLAAPSPLAKQLLGFGLAAVHAFVPPFIALVGGLHVYRQLLNTGDQGLGRQDSGGRRRREQVIMAICLLVAGLPDLVTHFMMFFGRYTYDVRGLSGLATMPTFAALLYSAGGKFRSRAEEYRRGLVAMTKKAAIGEMTQMLAHDVRKPFSMLRMGLDTLARTKNEHELQAVIETLSAQVNKSIRAVGGMIEDVMAVSSEPVLSTEFVTIEALIAQCLQETFVNHSDAAVEFRYDLAPALILRVDSLKILRVLSNIVENAIQATKGKCSIWFQTQYLGTDQDQILELVVGNSNSYIEPEVCRHIFEAFFTSGKVGGIGLGLAVAQRFTELHGGSITCRSSRERGTEFVISLPLGYGGALEEQMAGVPVRLPAKSSDIVDPLKAAAARLRHDTNASLTAAEVAVQSRILAAVMRLQRPVRLLLVDDETIYTKALTALLDCLAGVAKDGHLANLVDINAANGFEQAMAWAQEKVFDVGIFDVDLGDATMDGLDLLEQLRRQQKVALACVHSNRALPSDYKRAEAAGAHSIVPKPMDRLSMLTIVAEGAAMATAVAPLPALPGRAGASRAELVIVVDDDVFIREAWQHRLKETGCMVFATPAAVLAWIDAKPTELEGVAGFVLDYYLEADLNGIELAARIRERGSWPILLSTDATLAPEQRAMVDAVIAKMPVALGQIKAAISAGTVGKDRR